MRILGIDASSTAIGWAALDCPDERFELLDSNSFVLKGAKVKDEGATRQRDMTADERFVRLCPWLAEDVAGVYESFQPDFAIIERPQTKHPAPAMMEAVGMVRAILCAYNWVILPPLQVTSARKELGIGGGASKAETAEYVREQLGDSAAGLDEHAIDAVAVAMAGAVSVRRQA